MEVFNNREIATGIWLLVISLFLLSKSNIRESMTDVLKSALQIKIITPVFLMVLYNTGVIILLYYIGFWESFLLKDTILWVFFIGIALLFRHVTSKKSGHEFKKTIKDNIKITVVFEFIINTYTFSLWGELVFIPVVTFIGLIDAFAQTDEKYSSVKKLSQFLLTAIGSIILILAIYNAIIDYKDFGNLENLKSFALPIILAITILPYLYLLVLYNNYEQLFLRLELGREKSNELKKFAKKKIFKHCLLSIKKTNKALDMSLYNLMRINSKDDVCEMEKVYKQKL